MAAGSLLGVTLAHAESFPVGKVDMVRIFPMDFSEFLMANGEDKLCGVISHLCSQGAYFSSPSSLLLRDHKFVVVP